jgi:hypothetical protein
MDGTWQNLDDATLLTQLRKARLMLYFATCAKDGQPMPCRRPLFLAKAAGDEHFFAPEPSHNGVNTELIPFLLQKRSAPLGHFTEPNEGKSHYGASVLTLFETHFRRRCFALRVMIRSIWQWNAIPPSSHPFSKPCPTPPRLGGPPPTHFPGADKIS